MLYRVIRGLGNSDYVVGSTFDGDVLEPRRLRLLVEQRKIEPVVEPGDPNPGLTVMQSQVAALEAKLAAMQDEVSALAAANVSLTTALEEALAEGSADTPDLSKLKVDELKALAAERGIEGAASMTKPALIAALAGDQGGA